jgi:hypothetical protein
MVTTIMATTATTAPLSALVCAPKGAQTSAPIYSLVKTAKENKPNSFYYLTDLFENLPQLLDPQDSDALDALSWSPSLLLSCREVTYYTVSIK